MSNFKDKIKDVDYPKIKKDIQDFSQEVKKEIVENSKVLKKEFVGGLKEGKDLYIGLLTFNKQKIKDFFKK